MLIKFSLQTKTLRNTFIEQNFQFLAKEGTASRKAFLKTILTNCFTNGMKKVWTLMCF